VAPLATKLSGPIHIAFDPLINSCAPSALFNTSNTLSEFRDAAAKIDAGTIGEGVALPTDGAPGYPGSPESYTLTSKTDCETCAVRCAPQRGK